MSPVRALDTSYSTGLGGTPARLAANTPLTFGGAGFSGIPAGASAVTGNVTVVGSSFGWAVYLGPDPVPRRRPRRPTSRPVRSPATG